MTEDRPAWVPSWLRWPPNCCETCQHWRQESAYVGRCSQSAFDEVTDSRFRCPSFQRKPDQ